MYRIVRASTIYFQEYMKESKGRYGLVEPFILITDSEKFKKAKEMHTSDYLNLCDIIVKMRELFDTGEEKYHHFDMLLKELQTLGFDISDIEPLNTTPEDKLKEQIDLLLQFLSFRYSFDEFDNKTGTHDAATNKFLFIQP